MKADSIKQLTASSIAVIVVAGGLLQVYLLLQAGIISGDAGLAILGPLIGAAAAWAFGRESATSGARQFEAGVATGAQAAVPPNPPPHVPEQ